MPVGPGAAHVFVADLDAPDLDADDHHHLQRVLRLRAGEAMTVSDGAGAWRPATWTGTDVAVEGPIVRASRPQPALAVGFAATKGDKPELAVQKLTELGIDSIVVFEAERSVARWDADRLARNRLRLQKVARSVAMQSRRCWLPSIELAAEFAELARRPGVALADRDGVPPSLERPLVLVGPEGGWTDRERHAVTDRVALGDGILRAETATITVGSILAGLRAGLVTPS